MEAKMKTCAFFGSKVGEYGRYKELLFRLIVKLIEEQNVQRFYSGGRGKFDIFCAETVGKARKIYPQIENILALSYMLVQKEDFVLPNRYTGSEYLLERRVPPRYAIIETNKLMIKKADFIIVATRNSFGGARTAREYAEKQKKKIIDIEELALKIAKNDEKLCVFDKKGIEEIL